MNCGNCGGGLEPVGGRNYFRCPYCETFHFPEETGDGVAVVGGSARHACPVCAEALTRAAISGYAVDYCGTCRGFLADNATFGRVVQVSREKHANPHHVPHPIAPKELKRRVGCPKCRKTMDTHPYHGGGNAVIDTCFRCHLVWLDAGELAAIGKYAGGNRERVPAETVPAAASLGGTPAYYPSSRSFTSHPGTTFEDDGPYIDLFGFRVRIG